MKMKMKMKQETKQENIQVQNYKMISKNVMLYVESVEQVKSQKLFANYMSASEPHDRNLSK